MSHDHSGPFVAVRTRSDGIGRWDPEVGGILVSDEVVVAPLGQLPRLATASTVEVAITERRAGEDFSERIQVGEARALFRGERDHGVVALRLARPSRCRETAGEAAQGALLQRLRTDGVPPWQAAVETCGSGTEPHAATAARPAHFSQTPIVVDFTESNGFVDPAGYENGVYGICKWLGRCDEAGDDLPTPSSAAAK